MTMYSSYHRRTGRNAGGDLSGGFFVQTGGTGYKSAGVDSSSSAKSRRRKVLFAALYGSLGLLAVYTNGFDLRLPTSFADLRRQLTNCVTNVYATEAEVLSLPPVPTQDSTYLPSYIKLCYEWMRREAQPNPTTPYANLNVLENKDICVDWTAPHYAMMEIVASQILGTAIPTSGITYQHRCAEFRSNDEGLLGFDWTTFQTIYQEAAMGVDAAAICEFHVCLPCVSYINNIHIGFVMISVCIMVFIHHFLYSHIFINMSLVTPQSPTASTI